ncbi:hypothetical protein AKJ09_00226 [Labilithrix luteola]|uniref:TIGR02453 family protein n=1 Tax=Labilithrix luteola TaxID=1391654 RepID=A0A0K1PJ66_9BACT|nr:DUF2461 domain-containing protein [Labilithrix luteola]AKU93562.1 hypothetical protein AKJ09_00226 [Labilithrix luteola]
MSKFDGFADAGGKFFKALAKHNDREWFAAHKQEFEEGWNAPMKLLLGEVRDAIDRSFAHCDLGEPKVFRIFRDVRFSKDKSPYKTNIGGVIPLQRTGKSVTDVPMALYFQVGATETFAAAGHYMMGPESLARYRAAIDDNARGKELEKLLAKLDKKGFPARSYESVKRVPKGYEPDHPREDLIRRKGLVVMFPALPKGILTSSKLTKRLADGCKAAAPFVEWLVFATA